MKTRSKRLIHNMIVSFMLTGAITCASIASYEAYNFVEGMRKLNGVKAETRQILTAYAQTPTFKELHALAHEDLEYQRSNEFVSQGEYESYYNYLDSLDFVAYVASTKSNGASSTLANNENIVRKFQSEATNSAITAISGAAVAALVSKLGGDIRARDRQRQQSL